jgi:hypothetical protein
VTRRQDLLHLDRGYHRRLRAFLAPHVFYPYDEQETSYPPADDVMDREAWEGVMHLATDVALKTSSYSGSVAARLHDLHSDWIFSWPTEEDAAPFMFEVALLAGEEIDALVFNAMHGFYRQALGCLRNALETMAIAAGLAVTNNTALFAKWRKDGQEITFGQGRTWLRDNPAGAQIDLLVAPESVFGNESTAWMKARYATLCAYAHSQSGYNNADFWESNGPVYRPQALAVVETELRETLALAYLLLHLGWATYTAGIGEPKLLDGPQGQWSRFDSLLRHRLL